MSKPVFVYVTYIATTPEKLFRALTSKEATNQYWFGNAATSDWRVGSPIEFHREGKLVLQGKILENAPPRRLSYTFHPVHDAEMGDEPASRVVFDIEQQKSQIKLTVTHDNLKDGGKVITSISNGWPLVLSNLKSFLETGATPLHAPWYEKKEAAAS
jgi:uncharacterized protein YndB with AHSA1/START domain